MEPAKDARAGQGKDQIGSERKKQSFQSSAGGRQHSIVPSDHDVLCSQSRSSYEHAGNILFRELIAKKLPAYEKAKTKIEKTSFFRHVVNEISSTGGKFLKLDEERGEWFEVDFASARSKVGKAFRSAVLEKQGFAPQRDDEECDEGLHRVESGNEIDSHVSVLSESAHTMLQLGKAPETRNETQRLVDESNDLTSIVESAKLSYLALSRDTTKSSEPTSKVAVPMKHPHNERDVLSSQHATMRTKTPSGLNSSLQASPMAVPANPPSEPPPADAKMSRRSDTNRSASARQGRRVKALALPPPHEHSPGLAALNRSSITPHLDVQPRPPTRQQSERERSFHHRSVTLPIPPPRTVLPGNFKLPGLTRQLPNMLDTRELKRAMYRTLALRQQALEQNKASQHKSNASAPPNVDLFIGKAMASSQSPQEILQQALAVQKNAFIQGKGLGPDKGKPPTRVADAVVNIEQRTDNKLGSSNHSKTRETAKGSSPEIALVSPDSVLKPRLPASTMLNLHRIKRPRSFETTSSREPPKKKASLAEVATEHAIESQKKSGFWYCPSGEADDSTTSRFYFL